MVGKLAGGKLVLGVDEGTRKEEVGRGLLGVEEFAVPMSMMEGETCVACVGALDVLVN